MLNLRKLSGVALALLAYAPSAVLAQAIPGIPGSAAGMGIPGAGAGIPGAGAGIPGAGAGVPGAAGIPGAAAAPTRNIWSLLCPTPAQRAACRAKFCSSMFGKLISNSMAPMSMFTGGVIGQPCPLIPASALGMPPDSAMGAAAQVQKDTAEAAARRAAVRYLSTVDCNWWDQARDALINSLRADKNECVRLEAALALQRGCCCNAPIIKALVNTVSVFPDDANPPEDSPRVRAAAIAALDHCLSCYVAIAPAPPPPPPPPPPKEGLPPPGEMLPPPKASPLGSPPPVPAAPVSVADAHARIRPAAYHPQAQQQSMEQVVQNARRVLQLARQQPRKPEAPFPPGERSLLDVIENALHPPAPPPAPKKSLGANSDCCVPPLQTALNAGVISPEPPRLKPLPQPFPPSLAPQAQTIPADYSPSRLTPTPPPPPAQTKVGASSWHPGSIENAAPLVPHAQAHVEESRHSSSPLRAPAPPAQVSLAPEPSLVTSGGPATRPSPAAESSSADPVILTSYTAPLPPTPSLTKPKITPAAIAAPSPPAVSTKAPEPNREPEQVVSVAPTPPVMLTKVMEPNREHEQEARTAQTPPVSTPADSHANPTVPQLIACLQSSPSSDTRMWAVQSLISLGEASPTVVQALMTGAATDASDIVRFSCVHGLLRLGITDPALLAKLDWPQIDGDLHIREAAWRLFLFGSGTSDDPRVRTAAKELNQFLPSRSSIPMPGRS